MRESMAGKTEGTNVAALSAAGDTLLGYAGRPSTAAPLHSRLKTGLQDCLKFSNRTRISIGATILGLIAFCALMAPLIAPNDPNAQDLLSTLLPPVWTGGSWDFPLGTDNLGRCVLSRAIYGARVALVVGTVAPIGAMVIGTFIAIMAAYFGGVVNTLVSRAVDIWMSFPPVVMALILMI